MGFARWLVLGLLLIGCTVGIGSAVAVTGPVVIDKPGSYELTRDILDSKESVCIEIRCDNVVLDGKGHRVTGIDAAHSAGVLVHGPGPLSKVEILNVVAEDWFYGIYVWSADGITVQDCAASNNYFGVALNPASSSTLAGCRLSKNSYGLVLTGSRGNTISSCRITDNDLAGISFYGAAGNTFLNNLFKNEKNVAFINGGTPANAWNVDRRDGTNIVGGPAIGGNCWLAPDGTGPSATGTQDGGFITTPYTLAPGNVDRLPLATSPVADPTTPAPTPSPTVNGSVVVSPDAKAFAAHALPCTIQAEDFDLGGPGIGYFTPAPVSNTLYRTGTIAIERNGNESGYHLTNSRFRQWTRYTVEVPRDGVYTVNARASSPSGGQYFKLVDECHPKNAVTVWCPNTKSYDRFATTRDYQIRLSKGTHTLNVYSYGTQDMDWFQIS